MEWCAKDDVHQGNKMTRTGQAPHSGGAPDPVGLAVAQEMQERLRPAEVILLDSRAAGDHRPDSDVDLMAVCPDEDTVREVNRTVRGILEAKREAPIVNVTAITKGEFVRTAPLGQSFASQAARHGVTPDARRLAYQPERDPELEEVCREPFSGSASLKSIWERSPAWKTLGWPGSHVPALDAQTALERAFKGLLAAGNDPVRFRRDAALMWRHVLGSKPITDRDGARAVENLLAATMEPEGRCSLTRFTEAWRRGTIVPDPTEAERQAMTRHLAPAVGALVAEALARSGATREELQRERVLRRERSV